MVSVGSEQWEAYSRCTMCQNAIDINYVLDSGRGEVCVRFGPFGFVLGIFVTKKNRK